MPDVQALIQKAPSTKHQPISKLYYFDVALGSVCLIGADTGGAYCLLEVSLAPGIPWRSQPTIYTEAAQNRIKRFSTVIVLSPR
jgi:hypothetical protein